VIPVLLAHTPSAVPAPVAPAGPPPALPPSDFVNGAIAWHPGSPVRYLPPFSWSEFGIHWSTVIGIAVLSAIYLYWMLVVRRRRGAADRWDKWRVASYVTAQLVLFFSLNGPVHDLSDDYLFSAHMVQHLALIEIWAPLLVLSLPGWTQAMLLDWGAPGRALAWCTRPVISFTLFSVAFLIWHVQLLYGLMMRNHDVHIATHIMFMATAVLLWWPLCHDAPGRARLSQPAKMLYLFMITVPMMPVAAFISLATDLLYPWYAVAPRVFGLTPLQDQQIGGLIMWVPGNAVLWLAISVIFFRWALAQEKKNQPGSAKAPDEKLVLSS